MNIFFNLNSKIVARFCGVLIFLCGSFAMMAQAQPVSSFTPMGATNPPTFALATCDGTLPSFSQNGTIGGGGPSQVFGAANAAFTSMLADDFVTPAVTGPSGDAAVCEICVNGTGNAACGDLILTIYNDAGGAPGTVFFTATVPGSTVAGAATGSFCFTITNLPGDICLPANTTFWLSVVADMDFGPCGQWFWSSDISSPAFGAPSQFQNPGGGFGVGCPSWNSVTTCLGQPVNRNFEIGFAEKPVAAPPVTCAINCPADLTIELEPGECEEVLFFEATLNDMCGTLESTDIFGGSFSNTGNIVDATDNGTDISGQADNGTVSYSWTVPACASGNLAISFDWTYVNDESAFWDPFTLSGPNGTIANFSAFGAAPDEMGSVCESAAPGDVFTAQIISRDGVGAGGMFTLSNYTAVCASAATIWTLEQTSGIISGSYNPAGEYCVVYTAEEVMLDAANCALAPTGETMECEFCMTINEYTGPVTSVLACNDGINLSLDEDCQALVTADMILEGGPYACYDDYIVETSFGSNLITACGTWTVTVTDPVTGNSCWGTVTTEDKLAPEFEVSNYSISCIEKFAPGILIQGASDVMTVGPVVLGGAAETFLFENTTGCVITDVDVYINGSSTQMNQLDIIIGYTPAGGGAAIIGDIFEFPGCGGQAWNGIDAIFDEECGNPITLCTDLGAGGACIDPIGNAGVLSQFYGSTSDGTWSITIGGGGTGIINEVTVILNGGDGSCAADGTTDLPSCDGTTLAYVDWVDADMCGGDVITRTWTATDAKGNSSTQVQTITVNPIGLGDISLPPATLAINACSADLSPAALAAVFDDPMTEDDEGCPSDAPSVGEHCVEYNEGYQFAYPYFTIASVCNDDLHDQKVDNNICNIYATYTDIVIEACGDNECGGASGNKVLRTWTLLDWCLSAAGAPPEESSVEYTQVIKVVDLEAPSIDASDMTVSTDPWGCTATFPVVPPSLHDNCDGTLTWSFHGPPGTQTIDNNGDGIADMVVGAPLGEHIFTYSAEDCCGNVGTFDITVTVVDNAPPTAVGRENIVVSLSGSGSSSEGFAKIFTHHVDLQSFDGCTDVHLEIRRDTDNCGRRGNATYNADNHPNDGSSNPNSPLFDDDNGQYVTFCCADAGQQVKVWLRVWDDADGDGLFGSDGDNYNETWVHVLVEDKGNPVIYCPPDFTITCGWEWGQYDDAGNLISTNTGAATASAICDNLAVVADVNDRTNDCGVGDVEIEWCTVPAGNESPVCCEQVITITDSDSSWDPDDVDFQNDRTLTCTNIPDPEKPEWGEGLCDLIAWTSEDLQLYFEEDACYKVIRTYTVVNWCTDEVVTEKVTYTVFDDTAPVIDCGTEMYGIYGTGVGSGGGPDNCSLSNLTLTKSASDGDSECSSAWLEWKAEVDLWGDGTVDYTWSFAEGADENFSENRDSDMDGIYYLPKDTTVTILIPGSINHSCYTHTVKWQVNDGCNNYSSCTDEFMVVDKKAPTPFCVDLGTAIMENGGVEVWAIDFDLGAWDNCADHDDLRFTFTEELPEDGSPLWNAEGNSTALEFTQCGEHAVQIYVWDRSCEPNFEYCDVTLLVSGSECEGGDEMRMISGTVATELGESILDAEMTVSTDAMNNYPIDAMTDVVGDYAFNNNPMHLDYQIEGTKTDDYMNGVSTLDLVLIQKHILQTQLLDSPYKMIAADINHSESITAIDLVQLRKLILGVYEELPNNSSWRLGDANQALTLSNPWAFTETIDISDLSNNMMSEDFIGVKIGDVNGSVTANATSVNTENRSSATLLLEIADRAVKAGESIAIEVMSSNYTEVIGYQFTMNVDGLRITEVEGAKLEVNGGNVSIDRGVMTMSYHSNNLQTASKTEVLFTIHVIAEEAGSLSEMLHINSSVTKAEAYVTSALEVADVQLGVRTDGEVELVGGYELYQNEPNPFNGVTQVAFRLPTASTATLTVYDVTGKVVKTTTADYEKGYNTIVINKEELGASAGLLYYQLESGDFTATKKMIVIE